MLRLLPAAFVAFIFLAYSAIDIYALLTIALVAVMCYGMRD